MGSTRFILLLLTLGAWALAQTEPKTETPAKPAGHADFDLSAGPPTDPAAVARGQKIFVSSCGFCHGSNAAGGNAGPNLIRSVLVLHDKGAGVEIAPVILNGRTAKGMPKFPFSDAQIKDIAQFLASRIEAAANRMDYTIQNIVTGDAKAGESYFRENCASCHSPTGNLAHIAGRYDPVALQSKFLNPRSASQGPAQSESPGAQRSVTATLASGESVSGALVRIDDFSVTLVDSSGAKRTLQLDAAPGVRVEVHDPLAAHIVLLSKYSDADMHNILAYLETFK